MLLLALSLSLLSFVRCCCPCYFWRCSGFSISSNNVKQQEYFHLDCFVIGCCIVVVIVILGVLVIVILGVVVIQQ